MQPRLHSLASSSSRPITYGIPPTPHAKPAQNCWTRTINSAFCLSFLFILLVLICLAITILLVVFLPAILKYLRPLFYWISQYPITGYLLYMLLLILTLIAFIPETIFIIAASLTYKQALGFTSAFIFTTLTSFLAQMVGAAISFYLSRNCCRNCVRKCLFNRYETFKALDSGFLIHGVKLVILMRLSIFMPMVVVNYVLGITSVKFKDYIIGSCVLIVNNAILVFFGCSLYTFSQIIHGNYKGSPLFIIVIVIGAALCLAFIIVAVLITRHYLKKIAKDEQQLRAQEESEQNLLNQSHQQ